MSAFKPVATQRILNAMLEAEVVRLRAQVADIKKLLGWYRRNYVFPAYGHPGPDGVQMEWAEGIGWRPLRGKGARR